MTTTTDTQTVRQAGARPAPPTPPKRRGGLSVVGRAPRTPRRGYGRTSCSASPS
ncbi:hypothetical protein ACFQY4_05975 [Catellatospora bangladeshensis]|uniref:hypothetical protein n=1 Tax=Catellatospora bangladeshensis TaxID=310355 RepID=UPI003614542F